MNEKRKIDVPNYIDLGRTVTLKYLGNLREIGISDRQNTGATIIPLSKDEYIVTSTGEVKEVQNHAIDRTGNIRNLEKTMRNLSDLINANIDISNYKCCRFITLTYHNNERDTEKVYNDFRNFNKRFKRYILKQDYNYEYIVTIEAQGRGAFHLHCVYIFDKTAPFIKNKDIEKIWSNGFTSIKALTNSPDNIGRYITSYLSDMMFECENEIPPEALGGKIKNVEISGKDKRIIKGARLKLLPVGTRIYRYSKGIKKPKTKNITYGEALKELCSDGYSKVNEYAVEIRDTERTDFVNRYIKQTYKKHINNFSKKESDKQ